MPRYDKYGPTDDRTLEDLDAGFVGFNNRLRPDQLTAGFLAECNNARLDRDGSWSLRNGVQNKKAPLSTGDLAFTLPFFIIGTTDDDTDGITAAHGACSTSLIDSVRRLHITLAGMASSDVSAMSVNDAGIAHVVASTLTSSSSAITPTFTDGVHEIKITAKPSATSVTFAVMDYIVDDISIDGGSAIIKTPSLADTAVNAIYGACNFSDPNSNNNENYLILAANNKAVAVKTSDPSTTVDIPYNNFTISENVSLLQAFNKVFIFRKGAVAASIDFAAVDISNISTNKFELVSNGDYTQPQVITTAARDNALIDEVFTVCTSTVFKEGQSVICLQQSDTGLYQSIGSTSNNTRNPDLSRFVVNEVFEASTTTVAINAVSISDTTITIGCDAAHGLKVHQPIELKDLDTELNGKQVVSKLGQADGSNTDTKFQVEVASTFSVSDTAGTVEPASGFSFLIRDDQRTQIKTQAQIRDASPKFQRKLSSSLGFIHMPCPEFGVLHQRRLIVPYQFDQTGSSGSATISSRKVFDELIVSDILDSNTYDKIYASFRFNAGTSDFTVGIVSFTEDSILVFNKNSIHRVSGTTNPATSTSQLLTDEIGALARNTITQVGKNVFFLSDNGVYSLEFLDEYNLRGTQTPLSEPIQGTIDRINQDLAPLSTAVYFDNRYYIAVPLDTTPGQGDATSNNALLIYNFLNNQWESVDSVNSSPSFEYTHLIVSGSGKKRGVYCINEQGGVHLIAGVDSNFSTTAKSGQDVVITQIGGSEQSIDIAGKLKTRMYTYGDIGRKKFNAFDIQAEGNQNVPTDFSIKIQTENIDLELTDSGSLLGNASSFLGSTIGAATPPEDVAIRGRIGNKRAYGAQLQLENIEGKPSIRTIKTSATQTFRSTNPAT